MYNKLLNKINDLEKKYNVEVDNTKPLLDDLFNYLNDDDRYDYTYIMQSFLDLLVLDFCKLDDLFNKNKFPSDFDIKKFLIDINAKWFIDVYDGFMDTDIYKQLNQKLKLYRNKRIAHIATDFDYKANSISDDDIFEFMKTLYNHIYNLRSSVSFCDIAYRLKNGELDFDNIHIL